jgi:hypothetical protein
MQKMIDTLPASAVRTADGTVVSERDYFMTFEMPKELE